VCKRGVPVWALCLCSSCFKIPEAAVNLQHRALGKLNNVKRLFKGEAYRPTGYGITLNLCLPFDGKEF
jgi:hypothetical protein